MLCTSLNFINDPITEEDIAKCLQYSITYHRSRQKLRNNSAISVTTFKFDESPEVFDFTIATGGAEFLTRKNH